MVTEEKNLEDVLLELNLITPKQWEEILAESRQKKIAPTQLLRNKNILSNEVLTKARAIALKVPYVDLKNIQIPEEVINLLPEQAASKYQMIVFYKKDELIKVAMVDPTDFRAIDYLRERTNARIEPHIAVAEDINQLIRTYHSFDRSLGAVLDSVQETETPTEDIFRITKEISLSTKAEANSAPVVRLVNNIFDYAIKNKASDVHIEPEKKETRVRCRIDGILQDVIHVPSHVHPAIVSRIKIMSNLKIDEKRLPQDGRISLRMGKQEFDLRISTLPTIYSEKIVIRILTKSEKILTLEELGFQGRPLTSAKQAFKQTSGMFLSTGPTGCGKTTTLYSALSYVNTPQVNTVSLEDPVEHIIEGVNQVQINVAAGLTFGSGLRSIVRQDPNIIMVGEIRDRETAELAVNAALTGHLVFSTLHTRNAASSITRLIDIGVEPFLVASTVNMVIAQRLVRRICPDCKEIVPVSPTIREHFIKYVPFLFDKNTRPSEAMLADYPGALTFLTTDKLTMYRGRGCNLCRRTGYLGRVGIFEVMELTDAVRDLAIKKASEKDLEYMAIAEGMITLNQEGMLKVLDGVTTLEEVLRVAS